MGKEILIMLKLFIDFIKKIKKLYYIFRNNKLEERVVLVLMIYVFVISTDLTLAIEISAT